MIAMRINIIGKRGLINLVLAMLLLVPTMVQAKVKYKEHKAKILKELKLSKDEIKRMPV
jgi:type III secretory pathway component EscU